MKKSFRLRFRLYFMIIPLVLVAVLLGSVLFSFEVRTALTRIANRHLAFKAEQLRNYFYSEWSILESLDLDKQEEYKSVVESSFWSYAYSLVRSESELIIVTNENNEIIMKIGLNNIYTKEVQGQSDFIIIKNGWFNQKVLEEDRVGVAFDIEPFGWKVAITELKAAFFSDMQKMQLTQIWIIVITVLAVIVFLSIYIGYVIKPVERLTRTIEEITSTRDLSQRAQVEFFDEIGVLANEFNKMISTLQKKYIQLEQANRSVEKARKTATEHEEETFYLLTRVVEFRDANTGEHVQRISVLSSLFSKLLGQSREERKLIEYSSTLHDIGKIGIADSILLKPGKLTSEEFEIIKQHTVIGHNLLKEAKSRYLAEGSIIALTHHEKWDGSGYPNGLAGNDIPLAGRIVGIVDVLDALVSERVYKKAWPLEEALEFIKKEKGKQFDPELVDLFVENFNLFKNILA